MRCRKCKTRRSADDDGEQPTRTATPEAENGNKADEGVAGNRPNSAPRQKGDRTTKLQRRAPVRDGYGIEAAREHPRHQRDCGSVGPTNPNEHETRQSVGEATDTGRDRTKPEPFEQPGRTRHRKQHRKGGDQAGGEPGRNDGVDEMGERDAISEHGSARPSISKLGKGPRTNLFAPPRPGRVRGSCIQLCNLNREFGRDISAERSR